MSAVKKHTIQGSKKREIVSISQKKVTESEVLFPKKLKKVNKLLEKATLLPTQKANDKSK